MAIGGAPHVAPLEAILEENEKILFVEVAIGESNLMVYQVGVLETDRITTDVPRESAEPPFKRNDQRHLSHVQRHLKATAIRAFHLFQQNACIGVIVMGDKEVTALLEEYLHETLIAKIIGRIHASPEADPRDRKEIIESVLAEKKAAREAAAIEELARYRPGDQPVLGLPAVIEAFNLLLVRKLVIAEKLQQRGYVCADDHYLSLKEASCLTCGGKLLPAESIVDPMIEFAHLHGVSVLVVGHREDLLTRYEGIVAVTYPHAPQA